MTFKISDPETPQFLFFLEKSSGCSIPSVSVSFPASFLAFLGTWGSRVSAYYRFSSRQCHAGVYVAGDVTQGCDVAVTSVVVGKWTAVVAEWLAEAEAEVG